jgi:RecJ-like exonuclease
MIMKKLIMVVFVLFCVMEYSLANYHENQNEIRCEEILSAGMPCPECGGAGKFHRQVACNACNGGEGIIWNRCPVERAAMG